MKQSTSQKESLMRAAKYYHSALHEAEDYLAERGITLEVAKKVGLGVVLDPVTGHEQYENRLSIPYITRTGVVDLRFRAILTIYSNRFPIIYLIIYRSIYWIDIVNHLITFPYAYIILDLVHMESLTSVLHYATFLCHPH